MLGGNVEQLLMLKPILPLFLTLNKQCLHQRSTLPTPKQLYMDPLAGPRLKTFDFAPLAPLAPSERFVLSVTLASDSDASSIDPGIRGSVTFRIDELGYC